MNDDSALSRLLKTWQPRTPEPAPDFGENVWARIQRSPASTSASRVVLFRFPSTLRAAACWAAGLAAFGGSAAAYAYDSLTRDERMAAAHAAAIDPIQITAAPNTVHRH
ncbi:hypothetical protein CMV30_14005 [Nibricoccus aquaticus]|uniref:Uncharacterized protein n=1 Tax=Nibricoccus aquaticus TaxID=2576891 RepID=A0A290QI32_9BACT|nr:hypothetical protein [Nibricoccus aquaticus]ATC64988.1 hypothetical protein CMV30_14005 [Nibricoccus aquaticus]